MKKLSLFLLIVFIHCSFAGGPLSTFNGKPVRYKSDTVKYQLDRGPFGIFSNAQARALANASFKTWEDVPTATISFNHLPGDTLPVDVNASNFLQYTTLASVKIDSLNPIVFDSDGGITDALFGAGASGGVIGFAWTEDVDGDGYYDEGEAFMNGKFADGTANSFTYDEWKSTFVHEFGHFLGLDHTQINGEFVNNASKTIYIPTMYPTATADDVPLGDLNPDDAAAISLIYPDSSFAATTGIIAGSVTRANGSAVRGANVIASSTGADSLMNRISSITDYYEQNNGTYAIAGLAPGQYVVRIEPIDPEFIEGSSVGPYSYDAGGLSFVNPVTPEYYNGLNESGDPAIDDPDARTAVMAVAGSTVSAVNIVANGKSSVNSLLFTENFSFSGLLSANGWSVHSGTANPLSTTAGLTYTGYSGSGIGNAALINNLGGEDVNKNFTEQNGNGSTVYASLLVSVIDTAVNVSGDYFFHLGYRTGATTFTSFSSRLFARIVAGNVQFGISNTTSATYGATNFSGNTVYLAVTKYTINSGGNDETQLWILPSGVPLTEEIAGAPLASTASTAGQDFINAVGLRQGSSTASPRVVVDGIRITAGWPLAAMTSVDRRNVPAPKEFELFQNFPNPFNPVTTIRYSLPRAAHARLILCDVLGNEISTLVNEFQSAGMHQTMLNGAHLASGVYFYTLTTESFSKTMKLILMK